MRPNTHSAGRDARALDVTVHVCAEETLTAWARRDASARALVLTPERLHRRNLKHALAAADRPRSSLRLTDPRSVANAVADDGGERARLDRADRLRLVGDVLADDPDGVDALRRALGTDLGARAETVEAVREELDVVAGGRDDATDALLDVADTLPAYARDETTALLRGVRAVERALADRTDADVSPAAALRDGRAALAASDGDAWTAAYPAVERVAVAGVSTLGTALLDFLGAIAAHTDVEVHLFTRARTGPRIAERLPARLRVGRDAQVDVDVVDRTPARLAADMPAVELVTTTRRREARAALAAVDVLLERGVPASDVAVVARDVDRYERPLASAATEYGRHLSVWTQLALRDTLPYRLLVACLDVLAAHAGDPGAVGTGVATGAHGAEDSGRPGRVGADTLFAPLDYEWVPPDARSRAVWPLAHPDVSAVRHRVDDGRARTLADWTARLADVSGPTAAGVRRLLRWVRDRPANPDPRSVEDALAPLLDAFDDVALPARLDADTPALAETSQTARALVRSRTLLGETRRKYADWLDRGHVSRGWTAVRDVLDAVATTRPGRREHDNAERVDVLDANDTWLRDYRYVVAVGLVDGEWPDRPDGALPAALRDAVVAGDGAASRLGVRGAWTEERDADHFVDAVRAATDGLVLTRFTEDSAGATYQRSPLLEDWGVAPPVVRDGGVAALIAADRRLATPLRCVLDPNGTTGGSE
ncbi:hypothetical protein GCM10009037_24270 [Halarchaeum grantii]|uniref:ATP-dependent helicase/nuclease subunit B n=1 Tax=Halarchaeum grantii TaxID=1193105 RepID=A0A830F4Z5_9EURY|nr:hypothetical protein [Halarchaeum grantii]GGL39649.1 hypothetical protein GCM10009037_24270 [Halarchaeum grantii]